MKKLFKDNIKYLYAFLIYLIIFLIVRSFIMDCIYSYSFSYNIASGLIPYKDFNMVVTPLYSFIMSLFLLISKNSIMFFIGNGIIFVLIFYYLNKILKEKSFLVFAIICMFDAIVPSYNLLTILFILILIYLEDENKNDYLIGLVLALLFLTKQNLIVLVLGSLYYFKDYKKILKRIVTFLIPILIFLIYLIITKSFNSFLDLCLFGMKDFAKLNTVIIIPCLIVLIICIIYNVYQFIKYKNIFSIYNILFMIVAYPILDVYHFTIAIIPTIVYLVKKSKIKLNYQLFGYILPIVYIILLFNISGVKIDNYPNKINNFQYLNVTKKEEIIISKILNEYKKYPNVIFVNNVNMLYELILDKNMNKYSLVNTGNLGRNGEKKLLEYVKNNKELVIFIPKNINKAQINQKLCKYVKSTYKKIDSVENYDIYKLFVKENNN